MFGIIETTVQVVKRDVQIAASFSIIKGEIKIHKVTDDYGRKIALSRGNTAKVLDEIANDYEE